MIKFNFTAYDDIQFGPRLTEVPRFRLNRFRADGRGFNAHRRQFFSREKRYERLHFWVIFDFLTPQKVHLKL